MNLTSKSEFLENAFSAQKLVDFTQDEHLPAISNAQLCELISNSIFDSSIPLLSQRDNLSRAIEGKHSVSAKIINFCLLIDLFYESLQSKAWFDPRLTELHFNLKPVILKFLICDPKFLHSEHHFLRELLDDYFSFAAAWHPNLGTSGKQLFSRFRHLISSLQALDGTEKSLPENIAKEVETLNKLFEHFKTLETQLCRNERLHMNEKLATRATEQFLDQAMKAKKLPPSLISFLQGPWRTVLIHHKVSSSPQDKQQQKLHDFTSQIINTFSVDETTPHSAEKLGLIPEIKPTIVKYLGNQVNAATMQPYLSDIEKLNIKVLKEESYPTELAKPLLEENNPLFAKISQGILQASAQLKIGQILVFDNKGSASRCKISDIYFSDTKEFLFANMVGEKMATKSFVGVGYELVAKNYQLIDPEKIFKHNLISALEIILRRYDQWRKKIECERAEKKQMELENSALKIAQQEAEQLRLQNENMEKRYQEEAHIQRLRQEEMEKRIKEELEQKYREEAENLRQKNAMLLLRLEAETRKNDVHEAIQKVEALTIGSWISTENKSGEMEACKVAIIYPSNKKIVLVNRTGGRIGEYLPGELAQRLLDGKASILKQENSFEQSMQKVIHSLKR